MVWDNSNNDSGWSGGGGGGGGFSSSHKNDKAVLPVLQKIGVASVPFLKDFKTLPGKMVQSWMGQPKSFYPDCIDRLNGYVVPCLLLLCVGCITATTFGWMGGEPMKCLTSKELTKEQMEYALDYCLSKNHYFVAPDESIPWSDPARLQRQFGYYHWVPITLLLQALCFYLPSLFWNYACTATGINFAGLLAFAKEIAHMPLCDPSRQKYVDTLAAEVHDAVLGRHPHRIVGFRLGRRIGSYATALYLFTKLLYVANVAAQFLLLNAFIGIPFTWWGWDVLKALISGENWQDSPVFPRLTLCDIPIRGLGDSPRYTLQCHLRVNTYNEKFFFAIWWLFAFVAVSTACNFAYYAILFARTSNREITVRHLVRARQHRRIFHSPQKSVNAIVKDFADAGMQNDGILLFWFIQSQANTIVARETMTRIFDVYHYVRNYGEALPKGIAYNVLAVLPTATPKRTVSAPNETTSGNDDTSSEFGVSEARGAFGDECEFGKENNCWD